MPVQKFRARVSETGLVTPLYWFGKLELIEPHQLEFKAGQYLLLDVPGCAQKKSYSIASEPQMKHALELLVDLAPHGQGTNYIEKLAVGQEVQFYAPAGEFTLPEAGGEVDQAEKQLVFIGTGTGIVPLRSMYLDLLQNRHDPRPIHVYWGLRQEDSICWLDELRELQHGFPNFSFHIILSRPVGEWPLEKGHVTEHVLAHLLPEAGYYLCGNQRMIEDMVRLLSEQGIASAHIHREKFY